jgi:hypothetical protein
MVGNEMASVLPRGQSCSSYEWISEQGFPILLLTDANETDEQSWKLE